MPIFHEGDNDLTGFYGISYGPKWRPWESNDLFTLEIATGGFMNLGWVHGWPSCGNEHFSAWLALGNTLPNWIAGVDSKNEFWQHLVPSLFSLSIARNHYLHTRRLSPNLSVAFVYDREQREIDLGSLMLGLVYRP